MNKQDIVGHSISEVAAELNTSAHGLTAGEANARLLRFGANSLESKKRHRAVSVFIKQFKNSLIYLLLVACVVSFLLKDWNDGFVIAFILFVNTGLGFYQEYKSEKSVEKLQKLVGKEILVQRDDKDVLINEKNLVPGDLVILRQGDIVPADIRLFSVDNFSVNESQLTGESAAVTKVANESAQSLVYAGSIVEQGEGRGYVYATAAATELGKIANLSETTVRVTQYEQSLSSFSSFLIKLTFVTLALVFVFKLILIHDITHISSLALFMVALSIAVVPEAMPVIATVTLSNGALRLARQHVIAKTLSAVEDLGNINILCSDKTGTLTENNLTVKSLHAADAELFQRLAIASLENLDEKRKKFQSSFDRAFLKFVPEAIKDQTRSYQRLEELPFDPVARRRRVIYQDKNKVYLVVIGSAETLLDLTKTATNSEYGKIIKEDGANGLRHLAIAYKAISFKPGQKFDILQHEKNLKFVGFVSLEDPLRPSAKRTIALARKLGVAIKILSGDSREVTEYVARQVGLLQAEQHVYIGKELAAMSDLELADVVQNNHAFARLDPEQKHRIIKLLKLSGNIVGYQGDGINDAPALKLADVAIAVNHATDVAQESADILLLRDDLNVIISGIRYGRAIFANINKYIRYTMIGNFGNFFALSALYLLSANLPLLTTQLLLTNLLGDVPLIAISTDNVDAKNLFRPTKYNMHSLIFVSAVLGTYTAIFELVFFAFIKDKPLGISQTCLYMYLTIMGFVVIMSVRNKEHFWKAPPLSKALKYAFGLIAIITVAVVYIKPTQHIFSFDSLSLGLLGLIFGMTVIYFIFLDLIKVWFYKATNSLES